MFIISFTQDSLYDSDYRPTNDDMTSSDDSEIIPVTPNIARFKKHSPIKKISPIKTGQNNEEISQELQNQLQPASSSKRKPIRIQNTNNEDRRRYDKRFFCMYCSKPQTKLTKHLLNLHKNEEDVEKYLKESDKDEKLKLYEKIKNIGNHLHNTKVLTTGEGELVVAYRPRKNEKTEYEDYGPCPYCYAYFPKRELWRHNKSCKFSSHQTGKRGNLSAASTLLLPKPKGMSNLFGLIQDKLKNDDISRVAKSDPTITAFGEKLCVRHGHDKEKHNYVRQKLRELARLLQELRKRSGHISMSFEEFVDPQYFKLIAESSKSVTSFDETTNQFGIPSLALKLGHTLQKCTKIIIGKAIETRNKELQTRAEDFAKLLDINWTEEISSNALRTLSEANSAKSLLPLADDVKALSQFLKTEGDMAAKQITTDGYSSKTWSYLSEITLVQTILFNRRRAGEVSKMTVADYSNKKLPNADGNIDPCLSAFEQQLCKLFYRTEIVGKRGRTVPVIFSKQVKGNIDLLLHHRSNHLIVCNNYLFPTRTADSHIRGTDSMRRFANECGAQSPERLRSTKLRKQIATMSQVLNLDDNQLDILAQFMGHDIRVHRSYYRLPEATVQVAKISKLLLLMESGKPGLGKGQTLNDISLEIDDNAGIVLYIILQVL